jgi:hypothetical protein
MQNDPSFFQRAATLESVWAVKPTGNYETDCSRGRALAQEFAAYGHPGLLLQILKQMPSQHTGIEIGFLNAIASAAMS